MLQKMLLPCGLPPKQPDDEEEEEDEDNMSE
jgi:hypothetical protein